MSGERKKRCPYCGKRLPYFSAYMSRRKAEYVCPRCGKESRVIISKAVIVIADFPYDLAEIRSAGGFEKI